MPIFGEIVTAMVTPFNEKGKLDTNDLHTLIEHLITNRTDAIVVAGTTGEGPTLTKEEKVTLLQETIRITDGRAKIIMNAGSNNTAESIEFIQEIHAIQGVDGLMLVSPYYNKPNQEGLYQHFKTLANVTELPILLYNIPSRTGVKIESHTIVRLATEVPNIKALKESSGDLSLVATVSRTVKDFAIYSGDDNLTLPMLSVGAVGVVSVASHIVGTYMKDMIRSFRQNDMKKAQVLHQHLLPIFEGIFCTTNPAPIKHLLNDLEIPVGEPRLPIVPVTDSEKAFLDALFQVMLDYKELTRG